MMSSTYVTLNGDELGKTITEFEDRYLEWLHGKR